MKYISVDDIPEQGKQLIEDLISKGVIEIRDSKIQLDSSVYDILVILAKLGII